MLAKEIGKFKARVSNFGRKPEPLSPSATENGERRFLRFAASLPPHEAANAVIDVGSNAGDWTAYALDAFRNPMIEKFICVEPLPPFAREIETRFASSPKVQVIQCALGDAESRIEIYRTGGGGTAFPSRENALKEGQGANGGKLVERYEVEVLTGDTLCRKLALSPTFVKIDCDGFDGAAVAGFSETLVNSRPILQFEYSDFWLRAGRALGETCRLLSKRGYVTYWIEPQRLRQFRFNTFHETYVYKNIAALPEEIASAYAGTKTISLAEFA